jgi:beta-ribofuranosylaminobenzene 5'-phosphate synthase
LHVYVRTPSRLHLGLIDLDGGLGRVFGSIGLAITYPNTILEMKQSKEMNIQGNGSETCKQFIDILRNRYDVKDNVTLNLKNTIPEHVGLGSVTQISLAVAIAFTKIFDINASINDLALLLGRCDVSGIGTAIFQHGGFVIDGGKKFGRSKSKLNQDIPPILFHHDFPKDWMFVVAIPYVTRGLTDNEEAKAFKELHSISPLDVGKICRMITIKLLPSLLEHNIEFFGDALTKIQNIIGKNFSSIQGGIYSSVEVTKCIETMLRLGAYGVGQSSWGPTSYGLVKGERQADRIQSGLQGILDKRVGGQVFTVKADNRGAQIKIVK